MQSRRGSCWAKATSDGLAGRKFGYQLALQFNQLDVDKMLMGMPVSIFDNWYNHYMDEPWGYEYDMFKYSRLCTLVANGLFNPKTKAKPSDFYPQKEPEKEKTGDELEAILRSRFNG